MAGRPSSSRPPPTPTAWVTGGCGCASGCSLSDADFAQEYPENDIEAIQTTGRPVFRHEDLIGQPVEVGQAGEQGLVVYREPQPGHTYIIGADVGEGLATSNWSMLPASWRVIPAVRRASSS